MVEYDWRPEQAVKSLNRILPQVEKTFADKIGHAPDEWHKFKNRLHREWERLFIYLHQLYGWQYDFFYTLQRILNTLVQYWLERPAELKLLDEKREADPCWFLSEQVVGGVLYVDLFSDNLAKLDDHISYFKKLGPSTRISGPWRSFTNWRLHFVTKESALCWISCSTILPMSIFGPKRPNPTIRILWPITIPFRIATCRISFKRILEKYFPP
jgi:hypothetical protein